MKQTKKFWIENKENKLLIQKMYDHLKTKEYGVSFSWDELASVIGKPNIERELLYDLVNHVNKKLMYYDKKYLDTIHGFGKRIILPNEHGEVSRKDVKSAVRKYRKAGKIIACTNMEELDTYQQEQIKSDAYKWRTLEFISAELSRKKQISSNIKKEKNEDLVLDVIKLFSKE
jgi:hypothetical protein